MKRSTVLTLALIVLTAFAFGFYSKYGDDNQKAPTTANKVNVNYKAVEYGPTLDGPLSSLSESFESTTFPPTGWLKLNPITGTPGYNRQTLGTTPVPGFNGGTIFTPPGGGSGLAFCNYITGNASGGTSGVCDQWLVTPQITNVQPGDSLNFMLWKFGNYKDNMIVYISTTTPTVAGMTVRLDSIPYQAADSGWSQKKYKIGNLVPAGSNIYIGFREWCAEISVDGASFCIDLVNYVPAPVASVWSEQTSGTTSALYSVSSPNDNVAWAVGAAGIVYTTTNKGANWVAKTNPSTTDNYTVFAFDANNAIVTASGTTAYAYKTTNGGTNWTTVLTQVGGFFDDVQFKDANNGILYGDPVGGRWTIFKTTNAGTTWDSTGMYVATTAAGWNNSMYMNNNTIYFGTNNGTLLYSTNFGTSWTIQTTLQANTYVTWFNSASTGMTGGAELNMTTNSGANWTAVTSVGTGNISGIAGTGGNEWWMTRQTTTVNYSSNNGSTWAVQYTAPAGSFNAFTKSKSGSTLWGVRSNGGISRYGAPLTGIGNGSIQTPSVFSLSQNYPNPFNPTTKINYALPKSGLVTMKVYDILGKEVATLVNETKTAGNYTVEFNASNLSSGIYFYKISVNGISEVKKMSLIK
ncbi:MAG: T9SS type A sorting domain-containing protein [Bacteroidetes bacterium]|nr:T9SS type A sorting domain-containing protein [Bacteroidota bacterium]